MEAGTHKLHVEVNGVRRRYMVYVPSRYDDRTRWPVVLLFHGLGATARWTIGETGLDAKAEAAGFLAVFPEGLPADPRQVSTLLKNPAYWNTGSRQDRGHDDLGFIAALLKELPRQLAMDPGRLYVTGFSNGASFAFLVAAHFAEQVAAVAPVAGYCPLESPRLQRPVPTLYIAGMADPLVPWDGGAVANPWGYHLNRPPLLDTWQHWAEALGCPPQPRLVRDDRGVREYCYGPGENGGVMICYLITGHGHHWPGGRGQLAAEIGGPKVDSFRANDIIWEFFQRHTLSI
jgi:polyhydroxybutyrate depolymerase